MIDLIDIAKLTANFPEYIIELGVISDKTHRKEKIQLGITNAELMYIHENGSPLHHIPRRPVLDLTLKWVNDSGLLRDTINKAVDVYLKTNKVDDITKVIDRMCIKIQSYARHIIYDNDGRLKANAPSTIKRKGDNHPLFDTGQLARSITCRAIILKGGTK